LVLDQAIKVFCPEILKAADFHNIPANALFYMELPEEALLITAYDKSACFY